jgi:predicted SnoaL-like aldol condensation-catalyzing enzyme
MPTAPAGSPPEVVRQFQAAMGQGNTEAARALLADDLHFKGPLDEFHRADDYLAALTKLAKIVKGMENVRLFADGDQVGVFYDLVTNTPAGTSPTAEWYRIKGDRITEIQAIFDARPFVAMFAANK